jgi:hypothetical protein
MATKKQLVSTMVDKVTLSGAYAGDDTVLEWDYDVDGIWIKESELCFSTEEELDDFTEILRDMIRSHHEK